MKKTLKKEMPSTKIDRQIEGKKKEIKSTLTVCLISIPNTLRQRHMDKVVSREIKSVFDKEG